VSRKEDKSAKMEAANHRQSASSACGRPVAGLQTEMSKRAPLKDDEWLLSSGVGYRNTAGPSSMDGVEQTIV